MNEMITKIQQALRASGVEIWSLEQRTVSSAELFFIRRNLDMRRRKQVCKYFVTVFRDFEKDGQAMRGSSTVTFAPSQTEEEITAAIQSAYFAASFVTNPTYPLPEAQVCAPMTMKSDLAGLPVEQSALQMAEALFSAEDGGAAFLNSAEFFAEETTVHLLTSWKTDVCYTKFSINGEFVAQCKQPQDVEMYHSFSYDTLDRASLRALAADALQQVRDRAVATQALPSGTYTILLSGEHLNELLSYYFARTSVGVVYSGFSQWKVGSDTQAKPGSGERLNLSLHATVPYSNEGIPMIDRPLLQDGKVAVLHGPARLSSYLGVPATGSYSAIGCGNGTLPFAEMKKEPYLYPVAFSDFQMDPMGGHFGGEIRLAYYFDGKTTQIVTGGSINGSIEDCAGEMRFSLERYDSSRYHGPLAVRLPGVKVAGTV